MVTAGGWPKRQTFGYWAAPPVVQPSAGFGVFQMTWPLDGSSANSVPGFAMEVAA
ncbi:hypothetical protein BKA00_004002 [Actinomadura coerulea]|uniref:Uncharacterized protein n=1 Tax=Actinomadura coerulea TaxID=46159 RepID=A0A7X0G0D1_9ACTN|nr:hypothetical protein [Actinomadura coerulea]MBB6397088.1 hypothetical protein [Actinomadura coerulea]GGP96518.1 hypothetical protein GCM10010187_10320 [Actinomadura coerulea]